jgi:LacI family transcriptional regulator
MTERTNIKSVAREAGVSIKTVSRVINSHPDVAPGTRQRVQEVIDRLGYHPNAIAQGLRGQQSNTIAFVFLHYVSSEMFANPFLANTIAGIVETLTPVGFFMLTYPMPDTANAQANLRTLLKSQRVDGVIFTNTYANDPAGQLVADIDIPAVYLGLSGTANQRSVAVTADYAQGTRIAVEHLIHKGHRCIGYIQGDTRYDTSLQRSKAFRATLEDHGLPIGESWIQGGIGWSEDCGQQSMRAILASADRPSAIVAANDLIALGAIDEITAQGLCVPDDIAVIGFDDIPLVTHVDPPLTTIRTSYFQFGHLAATNLLKLIADREYKPETVVIPVQLVERASA